MTIVLDDFLDLAFRITPIEYFLYSAGGCLLVASSMRVAGLS
jgi:uncharacterized OsmC-like protein